MSAPSYVLEIPANMSRDEAKDMLKTWMAARDGEAGRRLKFEALIADQMRVVSALQAHLIDGGRTRSGDTKDEAIALGVAVDKLDVLIAIQRGR